MTGQRTTRAWESCAQHVLVLQQLGFKYARNHLRAVRRLHALQVARHTNCAPSGWKIYTPADGCLAYEPSSSILSRAHDAHVRSRPHEVGAAFSSRGKVERAADLVSRRTVGLGEHDIAIGYRSGESRVWLFVVDAFVDDTQPRVSGSGQAVDVLRIGHGRTADTRSTSEDLVIIHRGDTDHRQNVAGRDAWHIVELILEARTGGVVSKAQRVALSPVAFASQLPPAVAPDFPPRT